MRTHVATGLSTADGPAAFAEAADQAASALAGAEVDLTLVFAGAPHVGAVEPGLRAVRDRLAPRALAGCGAQGVVGSGREVENGGVAVWAASLPGARLETFHLEAMRAGDAAVAVTGMPELDEVDAMILLVDPYSFPIEPLLGQLADDHAGLPVVGGIAGAGGGAGGAALFHDDEVAREGAVGVALSGVDVRAGVSQGARPLGPEMVITRAERNVIHELASKPAVERITEAIAGLDAEERALAANGLLLGIVIDPNKPDYTRGDFLVRGLLGADRESGSLTVGELVRVGQAVRLHVRDRVSADEDLREILAAQVDGLDEPPAGALIFTCNGRGTHMFNEPDHDAAALDGAIRGAPAAGFFCAGEIGPVGDRSFVHGFTATLALFR
ncbi:MAG: FIST N-terminal domain-containing protein [Thermoleophilaceae bacterium]